MENRILEKVREILICKMPNEAQVYMGPSYWQIIRPIIHYYSPIFDT